MSDEVILGICSRSRRTRLPRRSSYIFRTHSLWGSAWSHASRRRDRCGRASRRRAGRLTYTVACRYDSAGLAGDKSIAVRLVAHHGLFRLAQTTEVFI